MIKEICLSEAEQIFNSKFLETLKDSGLRSFFVSEPQKVRGFYKNDELTSILIYRGLGKNTFEIDFVGSLRRREGAASALIKDLVVSLGARELWLELHEENLGARAFYEKQGFSATGLRENYYSDGKSALNMIMKSDGSLA